MELKNELIKAFGTIIEEDYEIIKRKITIIITAHCYAGNVGDNPLCLLNKLLEDIISNKKK